MKSNHLLKRSLVVSVSLMMTLQSPFLFAQEGEGNEQTDAQQPITFQGGASAEQSAGDNGANAAIGAASNVVTGGMFIAMAQGQEPTMQALYYAMAGLSFAQAAMTMGGGKASRNSQALASNFGGLGDGASNIDFGTQGPGGVGSAELAQGLNDLAKAGVKIDDKGNVISTDGKSYNAGSFGSAGALAAASGLSLGEAQSALDKAKKIAGVAASKYKVSGVGFETGGGGGGAAGSSLKFNYDSTMPDFSKLFGAQKRDPAAVAGMSKLVGGEPVGVAGDDIFKMMNRRYQTLNDRQRFMEK